MSADPVGGPIFLLILVLALHAWLNAAEAALRALNPARLRYEAEEGDPRAARLLPLAERHDREEATLRFCIVLTGLFSAAVTAERIYPAVLRAVTPDGQTMPTAARAGWMVLLMLALGFLLVAVCTLAPRGIGERRCKGVALRARTPARVLSVLLLPLVWLAAKLSDGLMKLFGVDPDAEEQVTEDDIRILVDRGEETGAIEENEKELIDNIFEFNTRSAEDVMTHRKDVTAVQADSGYDTVVSTILETGFSRFPVYGEDMDDILGILNTRDYLLSSHSDHPKTVRRLMRQAYFVPESVQADVLFRDMQKRKVHMAVVVDEYGGFSGVVTMEDLLEEIVGNIYDETDAQAEAEIEQLGENLWRFDGSVPIGEVNETVGVHLPTDEDYDTLGGLIFSQMTVIPEDGATPEMDVDGAHIRVEKLADHRVESALVSRREPAPAEETPAEE